MSEDANRFQRVREFWDGLTDRERKLLTGFFGVLLIVGVFLVVNGFRTNLNTYTNGIERGHVALDMLAQRREAYLRSRAESRAFDEKLENNSVQLAAFAEQMARRAGVGSPRNFRDQETPIPNSGGINKVSTTVTFPEVSVVELNSLLGAMENTEELIYIEGIEMEPRRRASDYEVQVTITTYRLAPEGS